MVNQTLDESSDKSDHNIDLDSLRLLIDINNNFKKLDINIKKDFLITKIQSCWRGYLIRKFFRKNKDKMKLDFVKELLKNYNNTQILYNNINK